MVRYRHDGGVLPVLPVLRVLVRELRARWPEMVIAFRADSGCANPGMYRCCERAHVVYTNGLIPNARLEKVAAPLLAQAQRAATGQPVRLVAETPYQAGSWDRERRVVY